MIRDDYRTILDTLQNPASEAIRQMEELSGSHLAERLTKEVLDQSGLAKRMLDRQLDALSAADQYEALAVSCVNATDDYLHDWLDAASLSELSKTAVNEARLHNDAISHLTVPHGLIQPSIAELIDSECMQLEMTRQAATVFSDYTTYLAHVNASLEFVQQPQFCKEVLDTMETGFAQMRQAAIALEPLERLSASLWNEFGSALTVQTLQEQLGHHAWMDLASDWQREYQSFVALAIDAMSYNLYNSENDTYDAQFDDECDPFGDEICDAPLSCDVYRIALQFVLPAYELNVRLVGLASHVDFTAIGKAASWDRMILAIAHAYPNYAQDLVKIALPLLQRLTWHKTPSSVRANGSAESLSQNDAEEFEALAHAMLRILKAIEQSISD